MQAIYTCKLYRASLRKQKISAAMQNPVNAELITQLEEYLDEEYYPEPAQNEKISNNTTESKVPVSENSLESDNSFSVKTTHSTPKPKQHSSELPEEDTNDTTVSDASSEPQDESSSNPPPMESATQLSGSKIFADTTVTIPLIENQVVLSELAGEIKGTLNARENTSGVSRTIVKNNELWIYYNDTINLNHVMSFVIDLLNAANYQYLDFNRLARTDNAMVFTINSNDTKITVGSVSDG